MKQFLSLIFFLGALHLHAQDYSSSIRGRVIDKDTRQPIPGVNVALLDNPDDLTGSSTDADGRYELVNLSIGRHELQFSFVGFFPQVINNVEVNSGRQTILNIELQESAIEMEMVEVGWQSRGIDDIVAGRMPSAVRGL